MRNIAQPCAICQVKLQFALDKVFLTELFRVTDANSCNAKRVDRMRNARNAQTLKPKKQFCNQSVTRAVVLVRVTPRTSTHSKTESKTIAACRRAQQSTGSEILPPETPRGLPKVLFLTKRPLIRASDSRARGAVDRTG
jgi:hypothetical protein